MARGACGHDHGVVRGRIYRRRIVITDGFSPIGGADIVPEKLGAHNVIMSPFPYNAITIVLAAP
jgi:hypothetical protein